MTGDESITAGEVIELGERQVRVVAYRDDGVVVRDYRKRVAVRNVATNRLSYVPEWRLLKAKRGQPAATEEAEK